MRKKSFYALDICIKMRYTSSRSMENKSNDDFEEENKMNGMKDCVELYAKRRGISKAQAETEFKTAVDVIGDQIFVYTTIIP